MVDVFVSLFEGDYFVIVIVIDGVGNSVLVIENGGNIDIIVLLIIIDI